ncbi:MAG: hypothetical protein QG673_2095 [Pseudomonadota bacterium]|nr:hypothetical protein [Pseudomonadota bacterium]
MAKSNLFKANLFKILLGLCLLLLNIGCHTKKQSLWQIVHNPDSMTRSLKAINSDFSVQVLQTGESNSQYIRVSVLKLSGTPVLAAVSQTSSNNKIFVSILSSANKHSIGDALFSPNSLIKRSDNMTIKNIHLQDISNPAIFKYLIGLGYTQNQNIIARQSQFYYNKEHMDLIEYILPSINAYLK